MNERKIVNVPVNRVEGDLQVRVETEDGVVREAWSSGTMYRGFERILAGRGALDGLVITPRVCGICSTAHLMAAAAALDGICGARPPADAVRARNLCLMTEQIQSDLRHTFLMFTADFCNAAYRSSSLYGEALERYEPFKGSAVRETVEETKKVLEILGILGGQWPHSSYMVPGGITGTPRTADLLQCMTTLTHFRRWYENRVLGCSLERWAEVASLGDLENWLEERESHGERELGFFVRFARDIGLDRTGVAHDRFLCYGSLPLPEGTAVSPLCPAFPDGSRSLVPAGFSRGAGVEPFDEAKIAEHVAYSWFEDYEGGLHPSRGETLPYACGQEGGKYSWAKAPRYDGLPAETGPLAEWVVAGIPLFVDLVAKGGATVFARQLARLARPAVWIPAMETWLREITGEGTFYEPAKGDLEGNGAGLVHGARGALGHWVGIRNGKIEHYQIVTPTTWNASPRDGNDVRGPWEEALVGVEAGDPDNPVRLGHVIRSFDACMVCTVHTVRGRLAQRFSPGGGT